jgi:4-hydroxy-tetrahydrodipicolinate synthase
MKLSKQKQWAKENYRGVENSPKAPFSPDFSSLDEAGIRLDVQHCLDNQFFSSMCASTYTTLDEKKQFLKVVCDEAQGKMLVGLNLYPHPAAEALDLLAFAESVGCTHAFAGVPRSLPVKTEDDVYAYYRAICDSTSLPIVLYGAASPTMRHLHPSGFPIGVLKRIADLPNIVGMKLTQPIDIALAFELCEAVADRLLIGPADLASVPVLAKHFGVQWVGQWVVESLQSPEKPYLVEFMHHIIRGEYDKAMKIYWHIAPAYKAVYDLQRDYLLAGTHPWAHINYYHWLTGGNGGLPRNSNRPETMNAVLDSAARQQIRATYQQIGIEIHNDNEEEFIVGKANYARGIRLGDLAFTPSYKF